MDELGKRLLALNRLFCHLDGRDGHIWIEENIVTEDEDYTSNLSKILKRGGVALNSKIYGGILEALDTIDEALKKSGEVTLLERYVQDSDSLFMGSPGIDSSRIDIVKKGKGGIF